MSNTLNICIYSNIKIRDNIVYSINYCFTCFKLYKFFVHHDSTFMANLILTSLMVMSTRMTKSSEQFLIKTKSFDFIFMLVNNFLVTS